MSSAIDSTQGSNASQADFMKLFMQELTYQDPLKPVDNREFMAQMAQFSALQEAQSASSSLQVIAGLTNYNLSLSLLGKKVMLKGHLQEGTVAKIEFLPNSPPVIKVLMEGKELPAQLGDITAVM